MATIRNPRAKAHRILGKTDAEWATIRAALRAHLDGKAGEAETDETAARVAAGLDGAAHDRAWNQLKSEEGL